MCQSELISDILCGNRRAEGSLARGATGDKEGVMGLDARGSAEATEDGELFLFNEAFFR